MFLDSDESTSSQPLTKPAPRKKVTRSRKEQELTEEEKNEVENEASIEVQVKKTRGKPSTKKTSKIPLSTRSVNKRETSISENNSHDKGGNYFTFLLQLKLLIC